MGELTNAATLGNHSRGSQERPVAAALRAEGVSKTYPSRAGAVEALSETNLEVMTGSFVSIVGPSGCGKSTLLKIIAGLIRPTAGRIVRFGTPQEEPGRDVGLMFQKAVLLPWRSVIENVLLPVDVMRLGRHGYLDRAHELLELTGLEGFADHRVWQLSGGMQQRAALCRALIVEPKLLLLDEPFGALDSITRETLNDELLTICRRVGITTVLVTHDVNEAVYLSDRVVQMDARPGRVTATYEIELERPRTEQTRETKEFAHYCAEIRKSLKYSDQLAKTNESGEPR